MIRLKIEFYRGYKIEFRSNNLSGKYKQVIASIYFNTNYKGTQIGATKKEAFERAKSLIYQMEGFRIEKEKAAKGIVDPYIEWNKENLDLIKKRNKYQKSFSDEYIEKR